MLGRWVGLGWGALACSGDEVPTTEGNPPPPAPPADTRPVDTGTVPKPPPPKPKFGQVTVRLGQDRLLPEVRLMIADADGTFVRTEVTTDAELTIEDVPIEGFVTEVVDAFSGPRLTTIRGVRDGDRLTFPNSAVQAPVDVGSYTLQIPDSPDVDFAIWELQSACIALANAPFPLNQTIPLSSSCHTGTTVDAFAWALSPTLEPLAIAFVAGSSLQGMPPDLSGTVQMGPWLEDYGEYDVQYFHQGPDSSVDLSVEARRGGRPFPQGLAKFQLLSDQGISGLRSPADAAFHDEIQVRIGVQETGVAARVERIDAVRSVPGGGQVAGLQRERDALPVVPEGWTFDLSKTVFELPLPKDWVCDGRGGNLMTITVGNPQEATTWTLVGAFSRTVALPELDPASDPTPTSGWTEGEAQVHSMEGGFDALRNAPELTEHPSTWLSATGKPGAVCTSVERF
ncbi:MAG: hypothetical protein AAGA48_04840 [Myxococcota bacterium]